MAYHKFDTEDKFTNSHKNTTLNTSNAILQQKQINILGYSVNQMIVFEGIMNCASVVRNHPSFLFHLP